MKLDTRYAVIGILGLLIVALFLYTHAVPLWLLRLLLASATFVAFGLLLYGAVLTLSRDKSLSDALEFYRDELDEADGSALAKLADSQLIKQAVASTAKVAEKRGYVELVELRLEQADIHLRVNEAMFTVLVATFVGVVLAFALLGFVFGLIAASILIASPGVLLSHLAKRRRNRFTRQLPGALDLLAGTMRAGFSLSQGMQAISEEVENPMAMELQRVISEERLGRNLPDALQDVADRMQSDDFSWAVLAIRIQRQVGGNLAELLTSVGHTMVERERLRREVRSLTAEGRLSAIVLVSLPPGVGGLVWFMNPTYIQPMLANSFGQMCIGAGFVSMLIGWFVMRRMIDIKA